MRLRNASRFQISNFKFQKAAVFLLMFEVYVLIFAAGCGGTRPVIKFGLVAPFEGRYRPVGYDAIYAARLAVRERNAAGGAGGYRVELVAYDDGGDPPSAVERAGQLALDPQVVAVIGHLRVETTRAAWDVYARTSLPLIAPVIPADALPDAPCAGCAFPAALRSGPLRASLRGSVSLEQVMAGLAPTGAQFSTGVLWPGDAPNAQAFIAGYRQVSNGSEPGPYAWATYQAAQMLFDAMARASGDMTRRRIGAELAASGFDARGIRPNVPVYTYRLDEAGRPRLLR
jgi:ABC-type branched-subunit amino acid transport system substrate-binding protein